VCRSPDRDAIARVGRSHDEVAMSFHLPPNEVLVAFLLATLLIALAASPDPPPEDEPP
jgi:hypothetical protein